MTHRGGFTEDHLAQIVIYSLGENTDPRLRELLSALIRHLHDFVKETELTEDKVLKNRCLAVWNNTDDRWRLLAHQPTPTA